MFPAGIKVLALAAAARITATGNGSAVDVRPYKGHALLVLNSSATEASDNTLNVKVQHSADGSTGWTDTGVAFAQVGNAAASAQVVEVNVDRFKRYIRVVSTLAGTTPAATRSVELIAQADRS